MSDRTQIDDIKSKLDIVSVILPYIPSLKRSGHNYFGLCPFHKEKTPSFSVNSELGLFKCFGCGEGGDVIKFIEKIEGIDFIKALEIAANRAGVQLVHQTNPLQIHDAQIRTKILQANSLTTEFFNYILLKHAQGKTGREYAEQRKLTKEAIQLFNIGFAPSGYENLKTFLKKRGFDEKDLVSWGLLVEKNGRIYDKFRNRLMFPVTDHQGDVVGFSGRLIDPEDKGPKYLNSPETPVYKKSKILFGLFQAKEFIRKAGFAVLVEGNIDILSSHKAGVPNIVAPLGTALTLEQLNLLKRYTDTVYFALDTDSAGQKALIKDLTLIDQIGMNAFVIDIKEFKDVDEMIINGGNWKEATTRPVELVLYFLNSLQKKYDLSKPQEKRKYITQILEILSKIHDPVLVGDYLNKLEDIVKIEANILYSELQKVKITLKNNQLEELPEEHKLSITIDKKQDQEFTVYNYLLTLLLNHQTFSLDIWKKNHDYLKTLMPNLLYQTVVETILFGKSIQNFSEKELEIYSNCALMPIEPFEDEQKYLQEIDTVIHRIKKAGIIKKIEEIKNNIKLNSDQDNMVRLQQLTKELSKLK